MGEPIKTCVGAKRARRASLPEASEPSAWSRWRGRRTGAPHRGCSGCGMRRGRRRSGASWASNCRSTPPRRLSVGVAGAEAVLEVHEECRWQSLCEHVGELSGAWNVQNADLAKRHLVPDEVYIELDVLGPLVVHWVPAHVDGGDVVAEHDGRGVEGAPKFAEERAEPRALGHGVGDAAILGFGA